MRTMNGKPLSVKAEAMPAFPSIGRFEFNAGISQFWEKRGQKITYQRPFFGKRKEAAK